MKFIRDIIRGAGYLEGYGTHPGNGLFLMMILMGAVLGAARGGFSGFLAGGLGMVLGMGPMWIIGCIGRARDCDRSQARLLRMIKNSD